MRIAASGKQEIVDSLLPFFSVLNEDDVNSELTKLDERVLIAIAANGIPYIPKPKEHNAKFFSHLDPRFLLNYVINSNCPSFKKLLALFFVMSPDHKLPKIRETILDEFKLFVGNRAFQLSNVIKTILIKKFNFNEYKLNLMICSFTVNDLLKRIAKQYAQEQAEKREAENFPLQKQNGPM